MKKKQIINNDCLIALKELDDNSVDSIVTDHLMEFHLWVRVGTQQALQIM